MTKTKFTFFIDSRVSKKKNSLHLSLNYKTVIIKRSLAQNTCPIF